MDNIVLDTNCLIASIKRDSIYYELDMKKLTKENAAELLKAAVEHKKEWEEKIKARYSL